MNHDILFHVIPFADTDTLAMLSRVSQQARQACLPHLFEDVVLEHEDQFLPFLSLFKGSLPFIDWELKVEPGSWPREEAPLRDYLVSLPFTPAHPGLPYLRTLSVLTPPPETLLEDLQKVIPVLKLDPINAKDNYVRCGYGAFGLDELEVETTEEDFGDFKLIFEIFNPRRFVVISLEDYAAAWRRRTPFGQTTWTKIEEIVCVDCFPLRPDQGDMGEGIAMPYMIYQNCPLRTISICVEQWDTIEDGILNTIYLDMPDSTEFPNMERFEILIKGRERYDAMLKAYNGSRYLKSFAKKWQRTLIKHRQKMKEERKEERKEAKRMEKKSARKLARKLEAVKIEPKEPIDDDGDDDWEDEGEYESEEEDVSDFSSEEDEFEDRAVPPLDHLGIKLILLDEEGPERPAEWWSRDDGDWRETDEDYEETFNYHFSDEFYGDGNRDDSDEEGSEGDSEDYSDEDEDEGDEYSDY